ncbi:hypothetical protein JHK86_055603 [Glycine max]|nr:hypothetical protein JHK86_055603 [Glycine max]
MLVSVPLLLRIHSPSSSLLSLFPISTLFVPLLLCVHSPSSSLFSLFPISTFSPTPPPPPTPHSSSASILLSSSGTVKNPNPQKTQTPTVWGSPSPHGPNPNFSRCRAPCRCRPARGLFDPEPERRVLGGAGMGPLGQARPAQALLLALGDRKGINRFGNFSAPLDEALIHVSLWSSCCEYVREPVPVTCVASPRSVAAVTRHGLRSLGHRTDLES